LTPFSFSFCSFIPSSFLLLLETGSYYVAQSDLELTILLPQLPKSWDYSCILITILGSEALPKGFFITLGIWTVGLVHCKGGLESRSGVIGSIKDVGM
jgi:hypothetical protein